MVTISNLVEKHVREKPFIQEGLSRGIINNAALAEEMMPSIEKELKDMKIKVKFSAVNMAIRRLSEKLSRQTISQVRFDKNSSITVKSDLVCITIIKTSEIEEKYLRLHEIIDYRRGDFATITHGINEVMITTPAKYKKDIEKLFPQRLIKRMIRNISSMTIVLPEDSTSQVGWFYLVTKEFTWENISIIDLVSTLTEMTILVSEDDTARAFTCLKKLIREHS